MKKSLASLVIVSAALSGCASYQPVPEGYQGPTAIVYDTAAAAGYGKGRFFVLAEVDGHPIRTSLDATRHANYGGGFNLAPIEVERKVPARPMKVKLIGTHATGAPIHELFSRASGQFKSIEGVVDFSPKAGERYVVNGLLDEEGPAVWIEHWTNYERVTETVKSK